MAHDLLTATIVKRVDINPELMRLWLEPSAPFDFKPGQYCTLGIGGEERPYSIASAPHEPLLELFIELVPEELATPRSLTARIWPASVGDTVSMRPRAKGTFLLDPAFDTQVFVSTVSGVAPFVSMLRAMTHHTPEHPLGYYGRDFERVFVFQGASYQDEFGYDEELRALAAANSRIVYRNTVSQIPGLERQPGRNKGWTADGVKHDILRVNRNLLWYFGQYGIQPASTCVYVCGHGGMVDDLTFGSHRNEKPKISAERPAGQLVKLGYEVRKEVYF